MEGKQKVAFSGERRRDYKRPLPQGGWPEYKNRLPQGGRPEYKNRLPPENRRRNFPSDYYSLESFVVLVCLTATLLILPLILPPLPPPPFLFLLPPVGILLVLLVLAFMPSDVRDLPSSSYL